MNMKEFQWNKIPKKDYFYFLHARVIAHLDSLLRSKANTFYMCLKKNGDVNAVGIKAPIRAEPTEAFSSKNETVAWMNYSISRDLKVGAIGKVVYQIEVKSLSYVIYRIPFRLFKARNVIRKRLSMYRKGVMKTAANASFSDDFMIFTELETKFITEPPR